jgi:hypothetical protein
MKFIVLALCILFVSCGSGKGSGKNSHVSFMPDNQLFLLDDTTKEVNANGIDETFFNDIIEKAQAIYGPIVAQHGGVLNITGNWSDSTVNAYANRNGDTWEVAMFGGMARRNEITKDGFALVLCHEIGHHLAGYPNYAGQWAANEGNSDYYATAGCASKLLTSGDSTEPTPNPTPKPPCPYLPEAAATPCKGFSLAGDTTVCQRSIDGALSLGKLLAVLGGERIPTIATPDSSVVRKTSDTHPKAQCRLDTMYQGILCNRLWNDGIIPRNKTEMATVSCSARPACWYKP